MSLLLPELDRQLRLAARARGTVNARQTSHIAVRRRLAVAAAALGVTAAIVAFLTFGLAGSGSMSAAQALEHAAEAAQRGLAAPQLAPGEYWYTRSIQANTTGFSLYHRPALIQSRQLIERWQASNGSGRERSTSDGLPQFFGTAAERRLFAGRESSAPQPVPNDEAIPPGVGFRSMLGKLTYAQVLALPTDPSAMLERVRSAARHSREQLERSAPGSPIAQQSLPAFELEAFASALTDLPLTPGSRAALYRAMARTSGVSYLSSVRDPLGRTGAALTSQGWIAGFIDGTGSLSGRRRVTNELVFDPRTGVLLAQQTVLDSAIPAVGLRAGSPIEYSAYVVSGNVASTNERFVAHGHSEVLAPAPAGSGCSNTGPAPAQVVTGTIPPAFLSQFAALRRTATSEDQLPSSETAASV
ncbi:MAG TPA: CU044_5270 family protein, partial [Solirubrobacteraceae bacterium]|nr:CU044_5270 family protein [Solirubrobacteraceae bacterium]